MIPKDTLVWSFCDRFNALIPLAAFATLDPIQKDFVSHYGWIDKDDLEHWRLSLDDERFINHSFSPNLYCDERRFATRTLRTIEAGEELLEDYTEFYAANEHQPFVTQIFRQLQGNR
jgi:hypothetical protein